MASSRRKIARATQCPGRRTRAAGCLAKGDAPGACWGRRPPRGPSSGWCSDLRAPGPQGFSPGGPGGGLSGLDGDPPHAGTTLRRLRQDHGEDSVLEASGHSIGIDLAGQQDTAVEPPVAPLPSATTSVLALHLLLAVGNQPKIRRKIEEDEDKTDKARVPRKLTESIFSDPPVRSPRVARTGWTASTSVRAAQKSPRPALPVPLVVPGALALLAAAPLRCLVLGPVDHVDLCTPR